MSIESDARQRLWGWPDGEAVVSGVERIADFGRVKGAFGSLLRLPIWRSESGVG